MKKLTALLSLTAAASFGEPLDEWMNVADQSMRIQDVIYAKGIFVAVTVSGVHVSRDGIGWTLITEAPGAKAIAYRNGEFVSFSGSSSATISTSADGTNWVRRVFDPPQDIYGMAVHGSQVVLVGDNGSYWLSNDAINFQRSGFPTNSIFGNVSSANGRCFASGYSSAFTYVSTNLSSWVKVSPAISLRSVVFADGLYVGAAGSELYTSRDGTTWTMSDYRGSGQVVHKVSFGGGYFLAGTGNPGFWTSRDGTNWTGRPVPPASGAINAIAVSGFCVVAGSMEPANGYLIRSANFDEAAEPPELSIAQYTGLAIGGNAGRRYKIEGTPNLVDTNSWTEIETLVLPHAGFTWFDESSPNSQKRFYRAVLLP